MNSFAQVTTVDSLESAYLNWYNKSPELDAVCGTAVDRAYETILKDKKPKKVIVVAVIDVANVVIGSNDTDAIANNILKIIDK